MNTDHDLPAKATSNLEGSRADLLAAIDEIGLARFVGRINSGVVSAEEGYAAVEQYIADGKERSFVSKVVHAVFGRSDSYQRR
jgi:hypothetical protein